MRTMLLMSLLLAGAAPLAAQPAPATAFTPEQVTAFNAAVAAFTEGQKAQQGGDNAGALAKYEGALPAIRDIVKAQPDNIANVTFLANVLYATAAANAGTQKMDAFVANYEESLPYWRTVVSAKPEMPSRNVLVGILTQLGNAKLAKQDKAGAAPFYAEALPLARQSVTEAGDATNKNLLLGVLIGASQSGDDAAIKEEVATLSKQMIADGSVSPANKPAADILAASAK